MKFKYQSSPSINPVTKERDLIYRPIIPIDIGYRDHWLSVVTDGAFRSLDALIDTGSDNNLGPLQIASILDIPVDHYPKNKIWGITSDFTECSFVPVAINIGGYVYNTVIGLGEKIIDLVLGSQGFLDHWQVKLEYAKEIELKFTKP